MEYGQVHYVPRATREGTTADELRDFLVGATEARARAAGHDPIPGTAELLWPEDPFETPELGLFTAVVRLRCR